MVKKRIEAVKQALKQKERPSALIVTSECNRRYMTNLPTSSGYVIITPENNYFFTDSRYIEAAKKSLGNIYTVDLYPKTHEVKSFYAELLKKEKITDILYEENYIYLKTKKHFDEIFEGFTLSESGGVIESMRKIKDDTEIENITKAQKITDAAFTHILEFLPQCLKTVTETDIAAEIEYFMKKNGAEKASFDIISVSGKKSSLPHGKPENIKLSKGFLVMDFGAMYDGYCSDMTRTVCIGKPSKKMTEVYNIVKSAQLAALGAVKAGIEGEQADKTARDIIKGAGYGENFGHTLGHSLGLEIHESPGLPKSDDKIEEKDKVVLAENNVVTIEPGIYLENEFGVRIEDLVVVKENGCVNLTHSSKELITL